MVPESSDQVSANDELREYELSGSDCITSSDPDKLHDYTALSIRNFITIF